MLTLSLSNQFCMHMEKTHNHNHHTLFPPLFFSLSTISLFQMVAAAAPPILIKVGVVLDLNDYIGQMGLNCISIAVSDFYTANPLYKTRLQIYSRDSKGDTVGAAAAGALSLCLSSSLSLSLILIFLSMKCSSRLAEECGSAGHTRPLDLGAGKFHDKSWR